MKIENLALDAPNAWHAEDLAEEMAEDLRDCGAPGQDATEAVRYYITRWAPTYDSELLRAHLRGYGGWEEAELEDDDDNLERFIWLAGGSLREDGLFAIDWA